MTHSDEPQGVFPREDPTDIPLHVSSLTRGDLDWQCDRYVAPSVG